jgi:phosphatidylglycerol:prolipoprotein diacylglycerol transferase
VILAIPFPVIDPVLVEVGPLAIRWYALAYIVGLVLGWRYVRRLARAHPAGWTETDVDDFLVWATVAVILGGRVGYVLAYNLDTFLAEPLEILAVWHGGMSFHGGLAGVALAIVAFGMRRRRSILALADRIACAAPIGLFLGRLANFVNGELYGRPSEVAWAMAFPRGGPEPRHPSQLYEAFLEGIVLFALLAILWRIAAVRDRPGRLTGVFLVGYALARAAVELVREPDAQLGFLFGALTMGQLLSLPLLLAGLWLLARRTTP